MSAAAAELVVTAMVTKDLLGNEPPNADLRAFYATADSRVVDDAATAVRLAGAFRRRYRGRVGELCPSEFARALRSLERIHSRSQRPQQFAHLVATADGSRHDLRALHQQIEELSARTNEELLFFLLEWIALNEGSAAAMLAHDELTHYKHTLRTERRFRPHTLSITEERLLERFRVVGHDAWSRLHGDILMQLRPRLRGRPQPLESTLALLQDPVRSVRRQAARAVSSALAADPEPRAHILNVVALEAALEDDLRGYDDWLQRRNLENILSDRAVEGLVTAVEARYHLAHRFVRLKAQLLGVDRLSDYDRVAPIGDGVTSSWGEARELLITSYEEFSARATGLVRRFFVEGWIDAAPRSQKVVGAFCSPGTRQTHPVIVLSFHGDRRSVVGLAHEVGHGLHYLLARRQSFLNARMSPAVTEVAAIFSELLVLRHQLASAAERDRLHVLIGALDDAFATVFRQIAMHRFEAALHAHRRTEGELTVDEIGALWLHHQKSMLGDGVELSPGYELWWSYVPHFVISPGYLYSYALGYLVAAAALHQNDE
ncbi:MAG: M3 family metallopeptidase [Gaiellaceae bacterium MAG52_C11]|nr:M3 family metallopeptidase [Candidatus Gaiellasilicea maunaloa]